MNKHSYILPVEIDYWHMHHLLFHLTSSVHIIENTNTWMRGRREKTRDENKQVSVTQPHRWTKALWLCNIHVQHTLIHLYLIYLYVVLGHCMYSRCTVAHLNTHIVDIPWWKRLKQQRGVHSPTEDWQKWGWKEKYGRTWAKNLLLLKHSAHLKVKLTI